MRYGNLLIEGIVTTHGSSTDAVNADTLAFELGSADTGNADGGSLTFKPGAGVGTGVDGMVSILPTANGASIFAFYDDAGTEFAGFKAASTMAGSVTWTLPAADGSSNQVLTTDGSGALSWVTVPLTGYVNVAGDTGTAQADITNDTLTFAGGVGITTVASDVADNDLLTISFSNHSMAEKTAPVLADQIVIFDSENSSAPAFTTFTDAFTTLNVVYGISANGFVVRTADDTYASRTITASTAAGEEGLTVTNGDGVAGDPTIALDIAGLTAGSVGASTTIPSYDGTNNVTVTPAQIVASRMVRGTFVDGDLTTGTLAIAHSLNVDSVLIQIYDEANQQILPDTITLTDADTTTVDLSSYGTIAGTWSYIIFG
jgi:hypothetical protein